MNTCKRCNASAWFNELTANGLCKDCNLLVVNRVQIHARRLSALIHRLHDARSPKERLRLGRMIIQEAAELSEFENNNIKTVRPHPNDLSGRVSAHLEALSDEESGDEEVDVDVDTYELSLSLPLKLAEEMDPLGTWPAG